jgi:hypothetical protein
MILQDILNRIKPLSKIETFTLNEKNEVEIPSLARRLFLSVLIILVASLSFGLGRLSTIGKREAIKIEYDPALSQVTSPTIKHSTITSSTTNQSASALQALTNNNNEVITSKNGTRYHYPHCAGAKQIKVENKITYSTAEAAKAAGYTLASNCKPK